jgi:hypothetical protein
MEVYPNAARAKRALKHPLYIIGCRVGTVQRKLLFKYSDKLPPSPPEILRRVGVNWLTDRHVPYAVTAVAINHCGRLQRCVRQALVRYFGVKVGLFYFNCLRLSNISSGRSCNIVFFVQTDAMLNLRSSRTIFYIGSTKRVRMFESEDLEIGSWLDLE